jgi:type IV secretory pathway VirB2 component (pilin)
MFGEDERVIDEPLPRWLRALGNWLWMLAKMAIVAGVVYCGARILFGAFERWGMYVIAAVAILAGLYALAYNQTKP